MDRELNRVIEELKEIIDPELGYDIVSLGMIKEIKIEKNKIFINFLPTTPFCPYLSFIIEMIKMKMKNLGYEHVDIEVDLENAWNIERVSDDVRKKLNL